MAIKYYKDENGKLYKDPILSNHTDKTMTKITKTVFDTKLSEQQNPEEQLKALYKSYYFAIVKALLKSKDYDNLERVAGYACRPTSKYNTEAIKILDWHESLVDKNYEILGSVVSGDIAIPNKEEYIAMLPEFVE